MNKCKVISKLGVTQLIIKGEKDQQLGARELHAVQKGELRCLLRLTSVQKGNSFKLVCDITGFITFREYLRRSLDKREFARILSNILENLHEMQERHISLQMLLLNFDYVYVNPATGEIYFVCLPIQDLHLGMSLRDFLLDIIQYCTFASGEDMSYVREYISILNNGINFSVFDLAEYVNKLSGKTGKKKDMGPRVCPQGGQPAGVEARFCAYCGTKLTGTTGTSGGIYDPAEAAEQENGSFHPMTTVLFDGKEGGTTVLGTEDFEAPIYPYLIRSKNQEKISVDKEVFRIGKEREYCDYFVSDNNAVSRNHADIIARNGRFFIKDLNSTNRTYVDGRPIPAQQETEIVSGTKLRLGNEDFVFYIS